MSLHNILQKPRIESVEEPVVSAMDRRVHPSESKSRRLKLSIAVIIAIGCMAYAFVRYGLHRSRTVEAERVVVSEVHRGPFQEFIPVTGSVEPSVTVYLDAVDGGQVAQLLAEEGAVVSIGQPLVRLNNANLQLALINSEAQQSEQLNRLASTRLAFAQSRLQHNRDVIDMRVQVAESDQKLARLVAVSSSGAIRRADVEDARLEDERLKELLLEAEQAKRSDESLLLQQLHQVDNTINELNKNLAIARMNLENLVIKAPIAGQLTSLDAHVGESKHPGQRIGQIDNVDTFKVTALIDEHYLSRISPGERATAEIDGTPYVLGVSKSYAEVKDRQFKVDLAFIGQTPKSIRRGQSLQLRLSLGATSEELIVSNGPFYEATGGQWVFVLDGEHAVRRSVSLGRRNPESIEVLDGLSSGDRIITSSYESFKEYDRVELR
jgi:HlyD family secretion protein